MAGLMLEIYVGTSAPVLPFHRVLSLAGLGVAVVETVFRLHFPDSCQLLLVRVRLCEILAGAKSNKRNQPHCPLPLVGSLAVATAAGEWAPWPATQSAAVAKPLAGQW